jgi:hypothetical protein
MKNERNKKTVETWRAASEKERKMFYIPFMGSKILVWKDGSKRSTVSN